MEKLYIMDLKEFTLDYEDISNYPILVKSVLNEKELGEIIRKVDDIKNAEDSPYKNMEWHDAVIDILKTYFNNELSIIETKYVYGTIC